MPVDGVAIHRQALSNRNGTPKKSMPPHPAFLTLTNSAIAFRVKKHCIYHRCKSRKKHIKHQSVATKAHMICGGGFMKFNLGF